MLIVHDPILVIDAFQMYSIEVSGYKFFTETQLQAFVKGSFQYIVPSAGLQYCNIVFLFIETDLIGQFHALPDEGE